MATNVVIEHPTFGTSHLTYVSVCLIIWMLIPWIGTKLKNNALKFKIAKILVMITLGQEFLLDIYQIFMNDWVLSKDLPLHMCGFGLFLTSYALWTKNQTAFEISYFWGLARSFQAIITPDPTRWPYGDFSVFWNYLSHGIIILNVLWLVFVDKMSCRKGIFLNVIFITNGTAFIVGGLNKLIGNGANYWFLSAKPQGDSPFLIGEWPLYLICFELAMFLFMGLVYLPMAIARFRQKMQLPTNIPS